MDLQKELDLIQATVYALMWFASYQDVRGDNPVWLLGLLVTTILYSKENDKFGWHMIEGVLTTAVPLAYMFAPKFGISSVNGAGALVGVLFLWNSAEIWLFILTHVVRLKGFAKRESSKP